MYFVSIFTYSFVFCSPSNFGIGSNLCRWLDGMFIPAQLMRNRKLLSQSNMKFNEFFTNFALFDCCINIISHINCLIIYCGLVLLKNILSKLKCLKMINYIIWTANDEPSYMKPYHVIVNLKALTIFNILNVPCI